MNVLPYSLRVPETEPCLKSLFHSKAMSKVGVARIKVFGRSKRLNLVPPKMRNPQLFIIQQGYLSVK